MWKPLIRRSADDWIGVQDGEPGVWIGDSNSARVVVDMGDPVWLWPLLERTLVDVEEDLRGVWSEMSRSGVKDPSEFIDAVVVSALLSHREYWMMLALDWVETMDLQGGTCHPVTRIAAALVRSAQAEGLSQRLAHRLRRMIRTISRD